MRKHLWIRILFAAMVVYDGILGLLFLSMPESIFHSFHVPPPNHMGYVQFPACLLIIYAWMFFNIARDPAANRKLIPYGIGLKVSYSGVVFAYWFTAGIPWMWQPFALIDALTAVLFVMAYIALGKETKNPQTPGSPE